MWQHEEDARQAEEGIKKEAAVAVGIGFVGTAVTLLCPPAGLAFVFGLSQTGCGRSQPRPQPASTVEYSIPTERGAKTIKGIAIRNDSLPLALGSSLQINRVFGLHQSVDSQRVEVFASITVMNATLPQAAAYLRAVDVLNHRATDKQVSLSSTRQGSTFFEAIPLILPVSDGEWESNGVHVAEIEILDGVGNILESHCVFVRPDQVKLK